MHDVSELNMNTSLNQETCTPNSLSTYLILLGGLQQVGHHRLKENTQELK